MLVAGCQGNHTQYQHLLSINKRCAAASRRSQRVSSIMDPKPNDQAPSVGAWKQLLKAYPLKRESMDKLIANYLIGAGYKDAAEKLIHESNVCPTVDPSTLDVRVRIVELIRQGCAQEAAQLVERFFPSLLENAYKLKFQLLQLHLIELIRAGCVEDALAFAQMLAFEIVGRSEEVNGEIERTMALLIFDHPQTSPFRTLLEQSHRDKVARTINEAILSRANQELPSTPLENVFRMVLWCQTELGKGKVKHVKMKDIASASLELE